MTGRIGRLIGISALAVALAGTVGGAAAQDSEPVRHFERFTQHEINMCFIAQALMNDTTEGATKDRYLANLMAFVSGANSADTQEVQDRADVLRGALPSEQLAALADACAQGLLDTKGPARFALPHADAIGEGAYNAYRRAKSPAPSPEPYNSQPIDRTDAQIAADRHENECRAIMDAGVEKATRSFRQAQGEIKAWMRAGNIGSPPGLYDIQNGCSAIGSAISQLNAKECAGEYVDALAQFRANYYIDFNGSSGFSCN